MKAPYVVGTVRQCADCHAEFIRQVHRTSYCPDCEKQRKKQWNKNARARRQVQAPTQQGHGRKGTLPGGARLICPGQKERVLRVTQVTFLPVCPVCHAYDYTCRGAHTYG